ncbi:MAG TPA: arylesterase [Methylomirabilota bacterium]|nr:arylesterase [Methylomirabilota bacterium]
MRVLGAWLHCAWLPAALGLVALAAMPARADERVIVTLGDSLTAGLGVAADEAYPALLQARLQREGLPYRVVNAGVSGDTTAGGRRRLDWVLRAHPEIVIVALGANDGLRGLPVPAMRDNLVAIVERLRGAGVRVLLAGMRLPPNYGAAYTREFADAFAAVARRTSVAFLPFLLAGVAGEPALNQPDGIHPNAAGQRVVADTLWRALQPLLGKHQARAPAPVPKRPTMPAGHGRSPENGPQASEIMAVLLGTRGALLGLRFLG